MVFGLPGVQIMAVYDAFYDRSDIRIITVRHEQTAAYMADGYARVTGKPGVALVAPGPGLQNASAALGTAYASSSPVLLLAGQVNSSDLGLDRGALHEINDQLDIVAPITKWCCRVKDPDEISQVVHEAMMRIRRGRPRPVEIEIPADYIDGAADDRSLPPALPEPHPPDGDGIRQAAKLLEAAKRPLICAGGGVISAGASHELTNCAEILGAPVATTAEGKGAIPEDHPLSLGAVYYGHGAAGWAVPEADVILAVGTRLTDFMYGRTALKKPQKLIHMDVDPEVIGRNYPEEIALVGDARMGLRLLQDSIHIGDRSPRWPNQKLDVMRRALQRWLEDRAPDQCEILRRMQRVLGDETILVSGLTNIAYWSYLAYSVRLPRHFITSSYYATLGYGFPLSLGAQMGTENRRVVAITGDGGFMYALPELSTAVRYGIGSITVVFVDGALGASRNDQRERFNGRYIGTDLVNPSFAELARVFGARGVYTEPDRLDSTLEEALDHAGPTVIEVPIGTWVPPFQIPAQV
jgi:acetolactate synthase-1/2/3 large subunit